MAKLTAKTRNALPSKDFAGPDRSYPIADKSHARNALARASQHASPELKARIKAKVARKYPGIKVYGEGEKSKERHDRPERRSGGHVKKRDDGGSVGLKGNKGGVTKDQERYGDYAQPKHENGWDYKESASPPSQGAYPLPSETGEGMSWHHQNDNGHEQNDNGASERKRGGRAKKDC